MKMLFINLILLLLFPNDLETFLKKGDEFHKKFDNRNAALQYEKAYDLAPDNYEVLLKLTIAYNDLGEEYVELSRRDRTKNYREEAKKYIDKAIHYAEIFQKKFPDSADVYCYLAFSYGNIAMFKGDKEKIKLAHLVKDNAEKSLKIAPDNYISYIILGIYNREIGNLSFFERLFANAFFGDVPDGSFEESIEMFNNALEIKPETIVPTYGLSRTYRYMDEEEKEKELLKKILSYEIQNFRDKFAVEKAKRRLENFQ
jgi:tetratricopeptide (TPR) repeat protein